jgi:opacity protein-like surface antigen
MAAMKRLEARVAALEGENKEAKREAVTARADAQALRRKLGMTQSVGTSPVAALPSGPHAMATKAAPLPPPEPSWTGLYVGASFGGALARTKIASQETYIPSLANGGGTSTTATSSGSDGFGAVFDAFLGINTLVAPRLLAGVQVEGTVSDVNFSSSGTRNATTFDANGPTGQSTGSFRPHVHARWMASALMRLGFLADPDTLVYGIAGWTGAQFEYNELTDNTFFEPKDTFWANGGSIGAGIERTFGPSWHLRAEYRYTMFQNPNVANDFFFTSSGIFANTQSQSMQTSFHNSMQVVRLGASYQLPGW